MFSALSRAEAATTTARSIAAARRSPTAGLHPAHRAAHGGVQGLDAQVVEQPAVAGDQVGDVQQREVEVARFPRRRVGAIGPVVPEQPPRMLGATTKNRSVSTGLPGPIIRSHQPGFAFGSPAPVARRVRVTGQRVADEHHVVARLRQLAVCLVDHLDVLEALAATQRQRVVLGGEDDPLGHGVEERTRHASIVSV